MSSINTSLSALLSPSYSSEMSKLAQAQAKPPSETVATQLARGLGKLEPGSKVSARFDYQVDETGKLKATGISIHADIEAIDDALSQEAQQGDYAEAEKNGTRKKNSFASLLKPKATLSPSAEAELFAQSSIDDEATRKPITASEEDGTPVEVQIFTPQGQSVAGKMLDIAGQLQRNVSQLYARNNFVVYNVEPALQFAA